MTNLAQFSEGKAVTIKTMFSRETAVSTKIEADVSIIWALLTNAADFARWNSTIISLVGNIQVGEMLQLKSTLDKNRTFKLQVKEVVTEKRLIWGDSQGSRVFSLTPSGDGVVFSMTEKIGGLFFPLFARFIPSFDESFEQFVADLKQEAEAINNSKN